MLTTVGPMMEPTADPRLMTQQEARLSLDPTTRMRAHALSAILALVPCRLALFWSIAGQMEVQDAVVLESVSRDRAVPIDAGFYTGHVLSVDPFGPSHAPRTGASLLVVADGSSAMVACSDYGQALRAAGLEHQVNLYLRSAGAVIGEIALFRACGAPAFERRDLRVLRLLHPLLEQGYAGSVPSRALADADVA